MWKYAFFYTKVLNFTFQMQLRKGMNVHKKMYETSWEPASEMRDHV